MNIEMDDSKFGIGVDIESIDRFAGLERTQDGSFLNKLFTRNELEYCYSKRMPAPHLAVRFAAKEAVIKALYSLGRPGSNYVDVEISNNEDGVPEVKLVKPGFNDLRIKLSLSHCADKAIAFVVVLNAERTNSD